VVSTPTGEGVAVRAVPLERRLAFYFPTIVTARDHVEGLKVWRDSDADLFAQFASE
jgi:hypothetical protein